MATIALCMIARNEAHVIRRALDSCRPMIDHCLVCDTGSTDGTQDIVREFLAETGMSGSVIEEPWKNFGANRSSALGHLRVQGNIDYALINDSDDVLDLDPTFDPVAFKAAMTADMYDVEIRHGNVIHYRPQILRNRLPFQYKGVLHEYIEGPPGHSRATAAGFHIRICGEGSRSRDPDKFARDAAMLRDALKDEHDPFLNSRYTFYLAQSLQDGGHPAEAMDAYRSRATQGHWDEEVYVSLLRLARLRELLCHDELDVMHTYSQASALVPSRAEALHDTARFLRLRSRFEEAVKFARKAAALPMPTGLFIEPWIYEYGALDELAVSSYWTGEYKESLDACMKLLNSNKLPMVMGQRIIDNTKFAAAKLEESKSLSAATAATAQPKPAGRLVPRPATTAPAAPITLVTVRPPGYQHTGAYTDLSDTVLYGLQRSGHGVVACNRIDGSLSRAIVIGAHMAPREEQLLLPKDSIIYNTEHACSPFMTESYIALLRTHPVWDYSNANAAMLQSRLGKPVLPVMIGFAPELSFWPPPDGTVEDVDVLFFGTMNPRRQSILHALSDCGLHVKIAFGVYGDDINRLISNAKVVINVHYYMPGHFEALRIARLLAFGKPVVTELNPGEEIDADLVKAVMAVPYSGLVSAVIDLVGSPAARRDLAAAGHAAFAARDEAKILQDALVVSWGEPRRT